MYTIDGVKVREANDKSKLTPGIYITNGKEICCEIVILSFLFGYKAISIIIDINGFSLYKWIMCHYLWKTRHSSVKEGIITF